MSTTYTTTSSSNNTSSNLIIPRRSRPQNHFRPRPRNIQTLQFQSLGDFMIVTNSPTTSSKRPLLSQSPLSPNPSPITKSRPPLPKRSIPNHFPPNPQLVRQNKAKAEKEELSPRRRPAQQKLKPIRTSHMEDIITPTSPIGYQALRRYGLANYRDEKAAEEEPLSDMMREMMGARTQKVFGRVHGFVSSWLWRR